MPWAAPHVTAYDLPIDESLRPDVASRAAASGVLDKDGQMSPTARFLAAVVIRDRSLRGSIAAVRKRTLRRGRRLVPHPITGRDFYIDHGGTGTYEMQLGMRGKTDGACVGRLFDRHRMGELLVPYRWPVAWGFYCGLLTG
jgi:hypothetical protein